MNKINIKIKEQLKNECALECLASVITYFDKKETKSKDLSNQIGTVDWKWRNWDYLVATLALKKGFKSKIYTRSTQVFDPSWFSFSKERLIKKLENYQKNISLILNSNKKVYNEFYFWRHPRYEISEITAAINFLKNGGEIVFHKIEDSVIKKYIDKKIPVFFVHNSTLLHNNKRKGENGIGDDFLGHHWGHVSLIIGYNNNNYFIADPNELLKNKHYYSKNKEDVLESIIRFDQNIYVIYK